MDFISREEWFDAGPARSARTRAALARQLADELESGLPVLADSLECAAILLRAGADALEAVAAAEQNRTEAGT